MSELYQTLPQRDLALSGHLVHLVDAGSGPAVLMIHGSPISSFAFRAQIEALKERFRVIAPDLLGFGGSSAPVGGAAFRMQAGMLGDLIDQLGLEKFDLVAHDWGGPVAYAAAAGRCERVRRLVWINTSVRADFEPPSYWRIFVQGPMGELITVRLNGARFVLPLLMRSARHRDVRRHYTQVLTRRESRRTILALERLEGFADLMRQAAAAWAGHAPPAMLLWGYPDPYFRRDECERMRGIFPNARVQRLAGAGHFPQEDAAGEVTAALRQFLGEAM